MVTVSAIQGNVSSTEKADGSFLYEVDKYLEMIYDEDKRTDPDIIVTPESAVPLNLNHFSSVADRFALASEQTGAVILLGAFHETKSHSYNSIFMFTPDGKVSETVYNKRHLVPFGEFLPFRPVLQTLLPFLDDINYMDNDLTAGEDATVFDTGHGLVGSVICFDSIFELLSAESVQNGAEMLAVSTNDSWFSDSSAIFEHNGHAILRAVENRRYVVRAANTGLSSVLTPRGEILAKLDPLLTGTISSKIPMRDDLTFFTKHPNLFPILLVSCAVIVFALPSVKYCIKNKKEDI